MRRVELIENHSPGINLREVPVVSRSSSPFTFVDIAGE